MNKLTKLMLASALLATSGFAQTVGVLNVDTTYPVGFTTSLYDDAILELADGVTLHNYITIQGPTVAGESAEIKLVDKATSATIKHYKDQIVKDDEFTAYDGLDDDYYRTMGVGNIAGEVTVDTRIKVESVTANAYNAIQNLPDGEHTIVFAGDDSTAVPLEHSGAEAVEIEHNLANELDTESGLTSKSLNVKGKYSFTGNNKHFNADGTSVNFNDAIVTFSENSLFQSDINVNAGSDVTISGQNTYPGVMTVEGGRLVLNSENFSFEPGSSLILKKFSLIWDLSAYTTGGYYIWNNCGFGLFRALGYLGLCVDMVETGGSNPVDFSKSLSLGAWDVVAMSSGNLDFTSLFSRKDDDAEVFSPNGDVFTYKEIYDCLSYMKNNPTEYTFIEFSNA